MAKNSNGDNDETGIEGKTFSLVYNIHEVNHFPSSNACQQNNGNENFSLNEDIQR